MPQNSSLINVKLFFSTKMAWLPLFLCCIFLFNAEAFAQTQITNTQNTKSGSQSNAGQQNAATLQNSNSQNYNSSINLKPLNTPPANPPLLNTEQSNSPQDSASIIQLSPALPISLSEALKIADDNNPQIVAARKNLDIARANIGIAKEIPNPTVAWGGNFGQIATVVGNSDLVSVDQLLETDLKRHKRTIAAQSQYKLAVAQLNASRWTIRGQVRQAYSDFAFALANLEALDVQKVLLEKLVNIAQLRVNAGAAAPSEYYQAQLTLSQLQTQYMDAQNQIAQAKVTFNALLGKQLPAEISDHGFELTDQGLFKVQIEKTQLVPSTDTPLPDLTSLYTKAQKYRPDLTASLQQVQANLDQLTLAKSLRYPDLQMQVAWEYSTFTPKYAIIHGQTFYSGIYLQAGVTVPLFHNQGAEISQAKGTLQQSQLLVAANQKQIEQDVHLAYLSLQSSSAKIQLYQQSLLGQSAKVLYLAQEGYKAGKANLASVILAQQSDEQTRQSYIQAINDYQTAWTNLEIAVGTPLEFP